MAESSDGVRKGLVVRLFMGETGVTMPDDTATAIDTDDFVNLGYLSEDGATMGNETEEQSVNAAQTRLPVRTDIIGQTVTISTVLIQRTRESMLVAFNGGTFSAGSSPGDVIFEPPSAASSVERAYVLEVEDGDVVDRYRIPRATLSSLEDIPINKNDPTQFPITLTMLDPGGGDPPWDMITNDPELLVASSS